MAGADELREIRTAQAGLLTDGAGPRRLPGHWFSVEAPEGVRFLIRSRLLSDAELAHFRLV